MIGKLIKYDFRSMLRKFLPLWAGLAVLGLLNGFTIRHVLANQRIDGLGNFLLGVLPLILLIVLGTILGVLTLVFICQRFYQGLLGPEGYLMFTLPVSSAEHILSKSISALLLMVLTALVFFLSGFLLLTALDGEEFFSVLGEIPGAIRELELPRSTPWLILEGLLYSLVSALSSVLHIYAAIALGHLASRHRVGWSMLAYVGLNTVLSTGLYSLGIGNLGTKLDKLGIRYAESGFQGAMASLAGVLGVLLLISLILGVIFFLITKWILDKSLNLE